MISSISPDSALRASGRFMVTTSVWSVLLDEAVRRRRSEAVSVMGTDASQKQERVLVWRVWP